jgi:hypothetical protein
VAGYGALVREMTNPAAGAATGLFATAAMSVVLGIADATGIMTEQPPRRIVASLLPVRPSSRSTQALAVAAHLGYGVAAGVVFSLLPRDLRRKLEVGTTYGGVVYVAGYEGWLPMLGIFPPAHRDRRGRVATMVTAHLVYGASLACGHRMIRRATGGLQPARGSRSSGG